jgi:hypothetical protein
VHRLALFEDFYPAFNAEANAFGFESLKRLVHGLSPEPEGAVVHRNHLFRTKLNESADGLFGARVD